MVFAIDWHGSAMGAHVFPILNPLPPPSPSHPSGSSQCTSPEHLVSCIERRSMPKKVQATILLHSFHMLARLCSKSCKLGFRCTWTKKFQMYKMDLEKGEEPEIKLPRFIGSLRNQGNSRNISVNTSASLTTKPFTMWITTNWKILRDGSIKLPNLSTEKPVCWSRSNN